MSATLALALALNFVDPLFLSPGVQLTLQARTLSAVPGYTEGMLRAGIRRGPVAVHLGAGAAQGGPWRHRTVGAALSGSMFRAGAEVERQAQGTLHRTVLRLGAAWLPTREWMARGEWTWERRPTVSGWVGWTPGVWAAGLGWNRGATWITALQVGSGLWVGAGWDAEVTTFLHWRRGRWGVWARHRRHALLGTVQEVALEWREHSLLPR